MRKNQQSGFTLVELLIVVVIIGVLAAIAYPAYQDYGKRARRADAKQALLDLGLNQEKWRANNSSYASTIASVWFNGTTSLDGYYNLTVSNGTATNFNANATPTGIQTGDDCGTFAITANGEDTSGSNASADCWNR